MGDIVTIQPSKLTQEECDRVFNINTPVGLIACVLAIYGSILMRQYKIPYETIDSTENQTLDKMALVLTGKAKITPTDGY